MITKTENLTNHEYDSSAVIKSSYNHDQRTLTVEFTSGKIYRYFNVEKSVFEEFTFSMSQGKAFHNTLKDNYDYEEL